MIVSYLHKIYFAGDPAGHHVIIVDDLVMTGGTLLQCAKVRIQLLQFTVNKVT